VQAAHDAHVNLFYCGNITDVAVVAVTSGCKQLTSLYLGGCSQITDAAKANALNRICVWHDLRVASDILH
jgi:hypothetical protein